LKSGDEEAADKTEDEDVALHDGDVKKYIPASPATRRSRCLPSIDLSRRNTGFPLSIG
jgi:hypothetical protein